MTVRRFILPAVVVCILVLLTVLPLSIPHCTPELPGICPLPVWTLLLIVGVSVAVVLTVIRLWQSKKTLSVPESLAVVSATILFPFAIVGPLNDTINIWFANTGVFSIAVLGVVCTICILLPVVLLLIFSRFTHMGHTQQKYLPGPVVTGLLTVGIPSFVFVYSFERFGLNPHTYPFFRLASTMTEFTSTVVVFALATWIATTVLFKSRLEKKALLRISMVGGLWVFYINALYGFGAFIASNKNFALRTSPDAVMTSIFFFSILLGVTMYTRYALGQMPNIDTKKITQLSFVTAVLYIVLQFAVSFVVLQVG